MKSESFSFLPFGVAFNVAYKGSSVIVVGDFGGFMALNGLPILIETTTSSSSVLLTPIPTLDASSIAYVLSLDL